MVSGTKVPATSQQGEKDFIVDLDVFPPGYPQAWFYVFMNDLGTNEFGVPLGFEMIPLPPLHYNRTQKCLHGGHVPIEQQWASLPLCAGAFPVMDASLVSL
jgi:hypothetical protein